VCEFILDTSIKLFDTKLQPAIMEPQWASFTFFEKNMDLVKGRQGKNMK
jgi:hypothetical protein